MTVTDAQFSGLSGDVVSLGIDVLDNSKIIMGLPGKADMDAHQLYQLSNFNTIDGRLDALESMQKSLIQYVTNIKQSLSQLSDIFTGHTGQPVWSISGTSTSGAHGA